MAIKDKNGNVVKLRGPNPVMRDQADWDASKVKLINCGWKSEVVVDHRSPAKEMKARTIDIGEELGLEENPKTKIVPAKQFIAEMVAPAKPKPKPVPPPPKPPEPEPEIDIEIEVVQPDQPVTLNVDPRAARLLRDKSVVYRYVPVVGQKKHKDDFYGDSYETPIYGEQGELDAVVVDLSDLQLQFWCVRPITKGTVLHRKDESKEGGERWWKVERVEANGGGYLVLAVTSDLNPDFS